MAMHIDAHQHFWIYNQREYGWIDEPMASIRRDFLPAELKSQLEKNGFHGSVLVQVRQTLDETRWLLELAENNPFILGVVGWADLRSPRLRAELESFAGNPKLVGIRHIVQSEPDDFLLQPDFLRGISILEEFDLVYDILIYTKHLPIAAEFVRRFPRQRFVLDHLAKPPIKSGSVDLWARGMRELASFPNVYAMADLEAGRYPALPRCGVRMLWAQPVDDRFRLAGVHRGGFVHAGGEPCGGLPYSVRNGGTRSGSWR